MLKFSAQDTKGGACSNFAYYSMLIILSWRPRGGPWRHAPPLNTPLSTKSFSVVTFRDLFPREASIMDFFHNSKIFRSCFECSQLLFVRIPDFNYYFKSFALQQWFPNFIPPRKRSLRTPKFSRKDLSLNYTTKRQGHNAQVFFKKKVFPQKKTQIYRFPVCR